MSAQIVNLPCKQYKNNPCWQRLFVKTGVLKAPSSYKCPGATPSKTLASAKARQQPQSFAKLATAIHSASAVDRDIQLRKLDKERCMRVCACEKEALCRSWIVYQLELQRGEAVLPIQRSLILCHKRPQFNAVHTSWFCVGTCASAATYPYLTGAVAFLLSSLLRPNQARVTQ